MPLANSPAMPESPKDNPDLARPGAPGDVVVRTRRVAADPDVIGGERGISRSRRLIPSPRNILHYGRGLCGRNAKEWNSASRSIEFGL